MYGGLTQKIALPDLQTRVTNFVSPTQIDAQYDAITKITPGV